MKKSLLIGLSVILLLALGAAFYFNLFTKELPASEEKKKAELANEAVGENGTITKHFGSCISELKSLKAINIDDVIQNCSKKEKTSKVDGGGGVNPQIFIYNDKIVQQHELRAKKVEEKLSGQTMVCMKKGDRYGNTEGDINRYYTEMTEIPNHRTREQKKNENFHGNMIEILQKLIGKGLLNQINTEYSYNICNADDKDCEFMTSGGFGRSDGTNYFVAGYRNDRGDNLVHYNTGDILYFVINDKLYAVGPQSQKNRQFAGIENGKIIVKRILDLIESGEYGTTKHFTLETCEIEI